MFCPNCGAQIPDDSIFCDKCGCRVGGGISKQRNHADSTSFPDERKSGSSKAAKYIVVAVVIAAVIVLVSVPLHSFASVTVTLTSAVVQVDGSTALAPLPVVAVAPVHV